MGQDFSFADFTRQCRHSYLPSALPPGMRMGLLYQDCEFLLDQYQPDRFTHIACRAGCGNCCIVNVTVLLPEALAIIEYLEERLAKDAELDERLDLLWTSVRGIDDEERVCMRQPCVFLDDGGNCSIYPVRPLLCRGVTSTDDEECRESFNAYLYNAKRVVQMNLFQRELYAAAYLGLSEGLEEQGLDGRGFELTGIVRYLRRHPHRREDLRSGLRLKWDELA